MSLATIKARLATLNGEVSGITHASEDPPRSLSTAQLPYCVPILLGIDPTGLTDGSWMLTYRFIIRVYGDPLGRGLDNDTRAAKLEPIAEALIEQYSDNLLLDSLSGILRISLEPATLAIADGRFVLDMPINVQEQKNVTFGV